jgi:hypothetical protein
MVADEETDEDEKWFELVRSERGFRFASLIVVITNTLTNTHLRCICVCFIITFLCFRWRERTRRGVKRELILSYCDNKYLRCLFG